jgi:GGDEF domain-containing protein
MIVSLWLRFLVGLFLVLPAQAAVPVMELSPAMPSRLVGVAASFAILPLPQPADPDALWNAPSTEVAAWTDGLWVPRPEKVVVGRLRLQSPAAAGTYVLQVADSTVDQVQVWYRHEGQPWQAARAGDRVPLSQWPFLAQFPSFALPVSPRPLDLMVALENNEPLGVALWLRTDGGYRAAQVLQSNFAGLAMGLGIMGALMCLVSAGTHKRRADWMVLGYALWSLMVVASVTGYLAIWFTPEAPRFNDLSKDFSLIVMGALLVAVLAEVLDQVDILGLRRWLGIGFLALGVAFALVYVFLVPGSWRTIALALWEALCVLAAALLCVVSWLRGSRRVMLPAAVVLMVALTVALQYDAFDLNHELDVNSILAALLLFASAQLLRHTLYLRERYGRDVLGRAAISASRDPLTALLSYHGMQHAYEEASLRQLAGRGPMAMMMFSLPRFDECGADHGFVVTERAVVRFAAVLQQVLGHEWQIGRLSKTRFGAIGNLRGGPPALVQTATRLLAACSRMREPLSPVNDFDLRILCTLRNGTAAPFGDVLRELEDAGHTLETNKRIALV